jgi:hypothetical protein
MIPFESFLKMYRSIGWSFSLMLMIYQIPAQAITHGNKSFSQYLIQTGIDLSAQHDADSLVQVPAAIAQNPTPNPIFRPIFPALKYTARMPILLPGYIPEGEQPNQIHAILETVTPKSYEILLVFTEDCRGGDACRLGHISGNIIRSKTRLAGKSLALREGRTGYFINAKCGANCSDATLTWDQNGHRYRVAIKAGSAAMLLRMANSAIVNGPL